MISLYMSILQYIIAVLLHVNQKRLNSVLNTQVVFSSCSSHGDVYFKDYLYLCLLLQLTFFNPQNNNTQDTFPFTNLAVFIALANLF